MRPSSMDRKDKIRDGFSAAMLMSDLAGSIEMVKACDQRLLTHFHLGMRAVCSVPLGYGDTGKLYDELMNHGAGSLVQSSDITGWEINRNLGEKNWQLASGEHAQQWEYDELQ